MTIDKDSNTFKEFEKEMRDKLNAQLLDRINDSRKEVAEKMVNTVSTSNPVSEEKKSGGQEAYQKFLAKKLKAAGYDSIADIPKDEKDDFFNAIDKEWEADDEKK